MIAGEDVDIGMVLSLITLGVSIAIPVLRLIDWLLRADQRFVVSLGRKLLWLATLASVPCFVLLVIYHQWTMAIVLAAVLVLTPVANTWHSSGLRMMFRPTWRQGQPPDVYATHAAMPDPDLVRRAAVVLEDYLAQAGRPEIAARHADGAMTKGRNGCPPDYTAPMSHEEACDVLGLNARASAAEIGFAHRRLMMLVHPDRGGTNYLAAKINRARDVLLANMCEAPVRQDEVRS